MAVRNLFDPDLLSLGNDAAKPSGNPVLESAYRIAALLEHEHEKSAKEGVAPTSAQVRPDRPPLLNSGGFRQVNELPENIGGTNIDPASASLLAGGKPVYYKPGSAGKIGTDKLDARIRLLPYIATPGKDPDEIKNDLRTLLTEPDDLKMVSTISAGPKQGDKKIVITKDISDALKTAGYEIPENTVMNKSDYDTLLDAVKLAYQKDREKRLAKTVGLDLANKEANLQIKKGKVAQAEASAAVAAEIKRALSGGTTVQSSKGDDTAATTYLESIKAKITPANIKWAKTKIK